MKYLFSQDKELIYENMDLTTWWYIYLFTLILELKTSFFLHIFLPMGKKKHSFFVMILWVLNMVFII
jgi:hypothetical protein